MEQEPSIISKDSDHKELHRVQLPMLEKYKAGRVKTVVALCGKVWSPEFPVDMHKPRCARCFPADRHKIAIAA